MEDFAIIEAGFNNADETINFGTRAIGYDTLYEISTIACLKCSEDNSGVEQVLLNSLIRNGKVFLTVNKSIKIFKDAELTDLLFNAVFDSVIDAICASPNGEFLLICLRSGIIHVLNVEDMSDNKCVFKKCLLQNDKSDNTLYIGSYVEHTTNKLCSFIIVSSIGKVFRVYIELNIECDEAINEKANSEEVHDFGGTVKVAAFRYPHLFANGVEANVLNLESGINFDSGLNLKAACSLGQKFLVLDMEGSLFRICSLTMLVFPVNSDTLFEEIVAMDDSNGNKQFLAVTKKNEQGDAFLQLLNSAFSPLVSLKISHPVHLVCLESANDEILIVSEIRRDGLVSELRMQCVYETEPELRLSRLLRKKRFEEAEKFARTFNIDAAVVLKARAQVYADKTVCTAEDVADLLKILDSVDDGHFKVQCCMNVECGNAEDLRRVLSYGSAITPKSHSPNREAVLLLQGFVIDSLHKLDTYMAIHPTYDTQSWSSFSTCNLLDKMRTLLKNLQIEEATIICARLDSKTAGMLTEENIEEILSILNNLPTSIYQSFLPTFVPLTMSYVPSALPLFVKWLQNKVYQLEKRDSFNFPDNGIRFSEFILKLLKVGDKADISFQRQCTLNKEGLDKLSTLMEALKGLRRLKNEFRLNVPLSEYLKGPKALVKTLLNIAMAPEEYDCFLKEFLHKFMIQNQIEPDEIFLQEIKYLIKDDAEYWAKTVEVILKNISSVGIKLEAIKEVLESARVPWCDTVRQIGHSALQYSHPMVADILSVLEDEPRLGVLWHPKYKIKEKQITTADDLEFVIRRIMYVNEPSMVKDVYQLCKNRKDRSLANNLLVVNSISKKRDFEKALSILDDNDKEEIHSCAKRLFSFASLMINETANTRFDNQQRDTYYSILGSFFARIVNNSDDMIENETFRDDLHILRAVYNINKTFQRRVTANDLVVRKRRDQLLEELIGEVADNFDRGSPDIARVLGLCEKLASYFSLDKDDVLVRFCQKMGAFNVLLRIAEDLCNRESLPKNLCLTAVLLLKCMGSRETQSLNGSFGAGCDSFLLPGTSPDVTLSSGHAVDDVLRGLRLAEKMISKALVDAREDELPAVVEVMNWVNTCFYMVRCQEEQGQQMSHGLGNGAPGFSAFAAVADTFDMYCRFIGQYGSPNTKYLTYFNKDAPPITESELPHEISLLPDKVDVLCREGQPLTAYKLLVALENGLWQAKGLDPAIFRSLASVIAKRCLPHLIHYVVSAPHIDLTLLQNLLLVSQKDYHRYVEHYLKVYKRQPRKLHDIAVVGISLLDHHKVSSGREVLVDAVTTCRWWRRLKGAVADAVPYDVFFKASGGARLKQLMGLGCVDVALVGEYCADYRLDSQEYCMEYLKNTLLNWKPVYEVKTGIDGKKSLVTKDDENSLHEKCEEIIGIITDKEAAFSMLKKIYHVANFYHYEVFICVLKILSENGRASDERTHDMSTLLFLKNYSRCSAPSQSEEEQWYGSFPDTQALDPLSEFRLPFVRILFTGDIWSIIRPEINLKTYRCWFDAINSLRKNLRKDDICIYAVKEVVSSGILREETSDGWILYPKFEDLFAEVDECVQHISDLEKATSVVYHLMYHTANGADKVNAAQLSYKYAKKYKDNNPNSSEIDKAYTKVKVKYYSFSAMHILHMYQVADEKYLQLVVQPRDLIDALYSDGRIISQAESVNLDCPDINKAVDALGALFNLDVNDIRYSLVTRWLNSSSADVDFDSSVMFPSATKASSGADDNLKRAMYVCSSGNKAFWQSYLLKVGMDEHDAESSTWKSMAFKARALKCFCAISDAETIIQMTDVSYNEFLDYVDKMSLLSELECLGVTLTIEALDQYNKKELLKRLSQIGKLTAVKVMATICMTYIIDDLRYWEFIVNSMLKLGVLTELKVYLDYLKNKCYKGFYVNAWQAVIDDAFNLPLALSEGELYEAYVNNFLMIQSCPVLYSLNFEKILQKCIKTEKFEFAAVLLHYLPETKRDLYVREIVRSRTLSLDLDNLSKRGVWGTRRIKSWLAEMTTGLP